MFSGSPQALYTEQSPTILRVHDQLTEPDPTPKPEKRPGSPEGASSSMSAISCLVVSSTLEKPRSSPIRPIKECQGLFGSSRVYFDLAGQPIPSPLFRLLWLG